MTLVTTAVGRRHIAIAYADLPTRALQPRHLNKVPAFPGAQGSESSKGTDHYCKRRAEAGERGQAFLPSVDGK